MDLSSMDEEGYVLVNMFPSMLCIFLLDLHITVYNFKIDGKVAVLQFLICIIAGFAFLSIRDDYEEYDDEDDEEQDDENDKEETDHNKE